jgi:hypothetical protein
MNVHEISQVMISSMKLEGPMKRKAGGVDPVYDDTEMESVTSKDGDDELPASQVESEAREGEDDDAVTETSDSNTKAKTPTRSVRMARMPKKYNGFKMMAAEIWLLQLEASLDLKSELSLIGATGAGFNHTTELHVMNYKQAKASADAAEWQVEVDKEHERMVKNDVWDIVPKASVPPKTKILKSVWAMKTKAEGTKQA